MNTDVIDDQRTTQDQARQIIEDLLLDGFEGDTDQLALALGRTVEEIKNMFNEEAEVEEDLVMKMRGIAQNREIEI